MSDMTNLPNQTGEQAAQTDYKARLQTLFGFNDADVRVNRIGKLSDNQTARLRAESTNFLYIILAALAVIGILAMFSFRATAGELFTLGTCIVVPGLLAFTYTLGRTNAALKPRVVSKVIGQVHLSTPPVGFQPPLRAEQAALIPQRMGFGGPAMYMLVVGDQVFALSHDQHAALRPALYTVYYVPTLRKIVALEEMADLNSSARPVPALDAPAEAPALPPTDDLNEEARG
jgi:hypothetical protein